MDFQKIIDVLINWQPAHINLLLFSILVSCGFGLPVPEDITLIAGGFLAYEEVISVHWFVLIAYAGVMLGDSVIFILGRIYGSKLLSSKLMSRILTKRSLTRARYAYRRYGNKIFFIARFLPGLRTPIYFTGGSLHSKFYLFFIFDSIAALISVPIWVYAAYFFGEYIHKVISLGKNIQIAILLIVVVAVGWKVRKYLREKREKQIIEL